MRECARAHSLNPRGDYPATETPDDLAAWKTQGFDSVDREHWQEMGFSLQEAIGWAAEDYDPDEAHGLRREGLSLEEAAMLDDWEGV